MCDYAIMIKLKKDIEKLNDLVRKGKLLEAFDRYYDKNIVLQIDGGFASFGRNEERSRESIFFQDIGKLQSVEVKSVAIGGRNNDVSMTEWAINIVNKEGRREVVYRVNVQKWKSGRIVNEKIYFCGNQNFKV
jgi:hypothetical protein